MRTQSPKSEAAGLLKINITDVIWKKQKGNSEESGTYIFYIIHENRKLLNFNYVKIKS